MLNFSDLDTTQRTNFSRPQWLGRELRAWGDQDPRKSERADDTVFVHGSIPLGGHATNSYSHMANRVQDGLYVKQIKPPAKPRPQATANGQESTPLGFAFLGLADTGDYQQMSRRQRDGLYVKRFKTKEIESAKQEFRIDGIGCAPFTANLGLADTGDYQQMCRRRLERGVPGRPTTFEQLGVFQQVSRSDHHSTHASTTSARAVLSQSGGSQPKIIHPGDAPNPTPRPATAAAIQVVDGAGSGPTTSVSATRLGPGVEWKDYRVCDAQRLNLFGSSALATSDRRPALLVYAEPTTSENELLLSRPLRPSTSKLRTTRSPSPGPPPDGPSNSHGMQFRSLVSSMDHHHRSSQQSDRGFIPLPPSQSCGDTPRAPLSARQERRCQETPRAPLSGRETPRAPLSARLPSRGESARPSMRPPLSARPSNRPPLSARPFNLVEAAALIHASRRSGELEPRKTHVSRPSSSGEMERRETHVSHPHETHRSRPLTASFGGALMRAADPSAKARPETAAVARGRSARRRRRSSPGSAGDEDGQTEGEEVRTYLVEDCELSPQGQVRCSLINLFFILDLFGNKL